MSRDCVLLSVLILSFFASTIIGEKGTDGSQMGQNGTSGMDGLKALFGQGFGNANGISTNIV